ncbi:hypothetical protein WJX79_006578 [Trebouxia sp. C0005]|nr:MAG: hypothetical protein FRX49_08804 [Trebouxia sp. A1-2]
MDADEVSLRPLSLRPGGKSANPFAGFGKGAGFAVKKQVQQKVAEYEDEPKKPASEIVRYDRKFLLTFAERSYPPPEEIATAANAELLIDDILNPQQADVQRQVEPEQPDTRDWRSRTQLPAQPKDQQVRLPQTDAKAQTQQQSEVPQAAPQAQAPQRQKPTAQQQLSGASPKETDGPAPQIQRAADVGRQAWAPNTAGTVSGLEKATKAVKGTLNKLTPEKFERLLQQLVDVVISAEILHTTISLVFESAVAQPTFVAMYADLCDRLSKQLPEFPPPEGERRPMSFRRVLLNTCQEEFEGAAAAREAIEQVPQEQKESVTRTAKMRTLGNIRLIAELFKKSVVPEKIVHMCIQDLTGDAKHEPSENNVEAVCELLTVAGKTLDSASAQSKQRTASYFNVMEKWMVSKTLPSRTRFMVRDLIELRRSNWIPRRAALQAKTIEEIHAEAHAELGMMPATLIPALESLSALPRQAADEVELFPSFKGGEDWQTMIRKGSNQAGESALTGDWKPMDAAPQPEPAPPAPTPAAQPQPAVSSKGKTELTEEQRQLRCQGLFDEFLQNIDLDEAVLSAQELATPEFVPRMVRIGISKLFEVTREKDQSSLVTVLVGLQTKGALSAEQLLGGIRKSTDQLEDLRLDIPKAPLLLGQLLAKAVTEGAFGDDALQEVCQPIEDTEARRELLAHILKTVQKQSGDNAVKKLSTSKGLDISKLLQGDPEFDSQLESSKDFLIKQGLQFLSV